MNRAEIDKESELYGDLVMGNFHDTYKNLIYKGLVAIKWIKLYCTNVDYVVKTDDDVFLNIFGLVYYLNTHDTKPKTVFCPRLEWIQIIRDKSSKWYVDPRYFPGQIYYPAYCLGLIYIFTKDIIEELYNLCQDPGSFTIEDVFFTGIVMGEIPGINWTNTGNWWGTFGGILKRIQRADPSRPVVAHGFSARHINNLWNNLTHRVAEKNMIPVFGEIVNYDFVR